MNDSLALVLTFVAGLWLGAMFFGGLWWTIRMGVSSKRPALWFLGSMVVRTGIVLAGFLFVSGGRWERIVTCLAGFVAARLAVTWLTRLPPVPHNGPVQEASHAP